MARLRFNIGPEGVVVVGSGLTGLSGAGNPMLAEFGESPSAYRIGNLVGRLRVDARVVQDLRSPNLFFFAVVAGECEGEEGRLRFSSTSEADRAPKVFERARGETGVSGERDGDLE